MVRFDEIKDDEGSFLWAWYLSCIRNGEFEELLKEQKKYSHIQNMIKHTLKLHATRVEKEEDDVDYSEGNVLFLSLPYVLNEDKKIINDFLIDNFQYINLDNILVRKICYSDDKNNVPIRNKESHYLVIDSLNRLLTTEVEVAAVQSVNYTENSSKSTSNNSEVEFINQTTASNLEDRSNSTASSENESASSIEINFKSKYNRKSSQFNGITGGQKEVQPPVMYDINGASIVSRSDIESINSFSDTNSATPNPSYDGHPLQITHHKDNIMKGNDSSTEDQQVEHTYPVSNESSSVDSSMASEVYLSDDYCMSNLSVDSQSLLLTLLPSLEMQNSVGEFKLVLQSMILINFDSGEVLTAIRQSNNELDTATEDDEWLLYDSNFSMDNLEIVTIKYLLDVYVAYVKMFFYSMVIVNLEQPHSSLSFLNTEGTRVEVSSEGSSSNLSVDSNPQIVSQILSVPPTEDGISIRDTPEEYYPILNGNKGDTTVPASQNGVYKLDDMDSDGDSILEYPVPEMYIPTKLTSNKNTALRSVNTNNSESTYKGLIRTYTGGKSIGRNTTVTGDRDDTNEDLLKVLTITPTNLLDTDLSKYTTTLTTLTTVEREASSGSLQDVERIKSISKSSTKSKAKSNTSEHASEGIAHNLKGIKQQIHKQNRRSKKKQSHEKDSKCSVM